MLERGLNAYTSAKTQAAAKNRATLNSKGTFALIFTLVSTTGYVVSSLTTSMRRLFVSPVVLRKMYSLCDDMVETDASGTPTVYSVESKYVRCALSVNWIFSLST